MMNDVTLTKINCVGVLLVGILSVATAHSPFVFHSPNVRKSPVSRGPSYTPKQIQESGNNPLNLVYQWQTVDLVYPSREARSNAIQNGDLIPANIAPLGLAISEDRIFVTMPRWRNGVPVSLAWLPVASEHVNPPFTPYPSWEFHSDTENPDCSKLMSVYRNFVDDCGRLWVIDSGVVNATIRINQVCPPKIVVFDLASDQMIFSYEFPADQVKEDSLHSNIVVDIRDGQCNEAFAYVTDVWRFAIVVFSMKEQRSWRVTNHLFYPHPYAADFTLHDINFQWTDGVFGTSMSPVGSYGERLLYFHPMAGFEEYVVDTAVLRNESIWLGNGAPKDFLPIGSRGVLGQSTTSGVDRDGVMFFTLLNYDAFACWDTRKPYETKNLAVVESNAETLFFPNDLKLDNAYHQNVWVLSNRLPVILYRSLDVNDINFRILSANAREAVEGTVCEP